MSKKSVMERNDKRKRAELKFRERRRVLRKAVSSLAADMQSRENAFVQLQKLPRDTSAVRVRNRCALTGRPRGVFRRFGISRTLLREMIMNGEVPGVVKSSW